MTKKRPSWVGLGGTVSYMSRWIRLFAAGQGKFPQVKELKHCTKRVFAEPKKEFKCSPKLKSKGIEKGKSKDKRKQTQKSERQEKKHLWGIQFL